MHIFITMQNTCKDVIANDCSVENHYLCGALPNLVGNISLPEGIPNLISCMKLVHYTCKLC